MLSRSCLLNRLPWSGPGCCLRCPRYAFVHVDERVPLENESIRHDSTGTNSQPIFKRRGRCGQYIATGYPILVHDVLWGKDLNAIYLFAVANTWNLNLMESDWY